MATWSALAQVTLFTDNFTTDSSLGSEWYNLNNNSGNATATLNPTPGQGLQLGYTAAATGKVNEEFALFAASPIALVNVGDYLTLTVNFNSPNLSGNTGGLLAGLYNSNGTPPNGNESSTTTGVATSDDSGYMGLMGFNTSAGTSTKLYDRNGNAAAPGELGYYSIIGASYYTQLASFAATGNANLANSTAYTLVYTLTKGAVNNSITATISQGATQLDSWTTTDAAGTVYNSFDELDFGAYGKNAAVTINLTDLSVVTNVPEPSIFAFAALGLLGFIARFRRR